MYFSNLQNDSQAKNSTEGTTTKKKKIHTHTQSFYFYFWNNKVEGYFMSTNLIVNINKKNIKLKKNKQIQVSKGKFVETFFFSVTNEHQLQLIG